MKKAPTNDKNENVNDSRINSINERTAHDKYTDAYIDILKAYEKHISDSVSKKSALKDKFFSLINGLMKTLIVLFFISVIVAFGIFVLMILNNYESVAIIIGAVTGMVSTVSTLILSIFKLPEIIAQYLFNVEEDKYMIDIIKNIQNYEINAVESENIGAEKAVKMVVNEDVPMQSSPNVKDASLQNVEVFEEPTDIQNDTNLEESISQNQNIPQSLSESVEGN